MTASGNSSDFGQQLLLQRERQGLKLLTVFRACILLITVPMVLIFSFSPIDKLSTLILLLAYAGMVIYSAILIKQQRQLSRVGLLGAISDIVILATLPVIWFYSVSDNTSVAAGFNLKTSITTMAFLLITVNSLTLQPRYPLLVTIGAIIIHFILFVLAWLDPDTAFTFNYLHASMSQDVHVGRFATKTIVLAAVGAILVALTAAARKMILETVQLETTNRNLSRYFSPNLVTRLREQPELLQRGGERREISYLCTDLTGFTSFVEQTDPKLVAKLLNDYLTAMIDIVFHYDGTVDKIVGDAIYVIFGAPVAQPDHAAKALQCALAMDELACDFALRQQQQGINFGTTRIGLNSGMATVGNFGSASLFNYTAYGDTINVAARLETVNKQLGTRITISEHTVTQLPGFSGRKIGTLMLKGKSQGLTAYQPSSPTDNNAPLELYQQALQGLEQQSSQARTLLAKLHQDYPDDTLVAFHQQRLTAGQTGTLIQLTEK